jgi:hypothetical protein
MGAMKRFLEKIMFRDQLTEDEVAYLEGSGLTEEEIRRRFSDDEYYSS